MKYKVKKNGLKSVETSLLLSNVIDADHQNSCLFTNKGHFSSPSLVLIRVLAKCFKVSVSILIVCVHVYKVISLQSAILW